MQLRSRVDLSFFLHCVDCNDIRVTLLNELQLVDENILKLSDNKLNNLLLHGDPQFDSFKNTSDSHFRFQLVCALFSFFILAFF